MSSENEFIRGDAGARNTELTEAGRMRQGTYVMMDDKYPCRITAFTKVKGGKHGAAKCVVMAKDIFTDNLH